MKYLFSIIVLMVFIGSCSDNAGESLFPLEQRVVEPFEEIPLDDPSIQKVYDILYRDYYKSILDTAPQIYTTRNPSDYYCRLFEEFYFKKIRIRKESNKIIYVARDINGYDIYKLQLQSLMMDMTVAINSAGRLVHLTSPRGEPIYRNFGVLLSDNASNYLATIRAILYLLYGKGIIIQNKMEPFAYWDSLNPKPDTRYYTGEWRLHLILDGVVQRYSVMRISDGIRFAASYCFGKLRNAEAIECSLTKSDGLTIFRKIEIGYPDPAHY